MTTLSKIQVDSFKPSCEKKCGGWDPHLTLPVKMHTKYAWREFEAIPGYHDFLGFLLRNGCKLCIVCEMEGCRDKKLARRQCALFSGGRKCVGSYIFHFSSGKLAVNILLGSLVSSRCGSLVLPILPNPFGT